MSLKPELISPVPQQTARVAKAAFPKGNLFMKLRDELGHLYQDQDFTALFYTTGQPALAPWRLVLVTLMQFMEGLSDRQAADAARGRLVWKYSLSLELEDSGFDFSVLSEFRSRLVAGFAEQLIFEKMLDYFKQKGLVGAGGRMRTDATHVLAQVRALNRTVLVGETLRATLNVLAVVLPEWLKSFASAEWYQRYERKFEEYRLPKEKGTHSTLVEMIGAAGQLLLEAIFKLEEQKWLRQLPAVSILRVVWLHQFEWQTDKLVFRADDNIPPPVRRGCQSVLLLIC